MDLSFSIKLQEINLMYAKNIRPSAKRVVQLEQSATIKLRALRALKFASKVSCAR